MGLNNSSAEEEVSKFKRSSLSKYLILSLFILLLGSLGYCFGLNKQQFNSNIVVPINNISNTPFTPSAIPSETRDLLKENFNRLDECNKEACLFRKDNEIQGYAKLEGYYHQENRRAFEQSGLCDMLIVTGGNETLINYFRKSVEDGNGLNIIDSNNNLIAALEFNELSQSTVNKIKSSTKNLPVKLNVVLKTPTYTEAPICAGFLSILSISE